MKIIHAYIILVATLAGFAMPATAQRGNDHGRAVAGKYDGTTSVELLQATLPLQVELQRTRPDSVIVKITRFLLPNGQVFNFTSKALSVKPETRNGREIYRLQVAFTYNYNNMPVRVQATATVDGKELEGEVKAVIMESMETRATYKGKRTS